MQRSSAAIVQPCLRISVIPKELLGSFAGLTYRSNPALTPLPMPVDGTGLAGTVKAILDAPAPTGELRVRVERLGKHSVVTDAYRTAPFHLGLPSDRSGDGSIELIVQGVGPGYLPGDRLSIDIMVGEGHH